MTAFINARFTKAFILTPSAPDSTDGVELLFRKTE